MQRLSIAPQVTPDTYQCVFFVGEGLSDYISG